MLTDFVCLYNYEFWLSLCKIVRSSVILLLPLFGQWTTFEQPIYPVDNFIHCFEQPGPDIIVPCIDIIMIPLTIIQFCDTIQVKQHDKYTGNQSNVVDFLKKCKPLTQLLLVISCYRLSVFPNLPFVKWILKPLPPSNSMLSQLYLQWCQPKIRKWKECKQYTK